ncbi:Peptidyl-prolyl cis-trans isomerase D [Candidatus Providencia siddallii]|uniref:Periplasmic chaperone PpiD n=1 Tax=Candidatus Providencia siddallii TaxID=1715285 RepID=A0A0M6W817_9GAMM|nr:Peptidyl-prolyl cis-trans isomerase D [Candidatus Providencia siddallii]
MIENLCKRKNNFLIKLLVVIIILSLILTGIMMSNFNNHIDKVVEVNGQKITKDQLQQAFQQERQLLQEYLGDRFSEVVGNKESINLLRDQVLDDLINNELINQYADELRFSVSDSRIEQAIFSMPIFFKNGHFDSEKYREILNKYNISADTLAEQIRKNIIRVQLIKSLAGTEFVLPSEIKTYAELFMQEREINTAILFLSKVQEKQSVSENEVKAYYNKNYKSFISPEQVKISYVKIDASSIPVEKIPDEEVKNFYKKNIKNYISPEQKQYGLIQVTSENEANSIIDSFKNGTDFSKLAIEKSTDKFTANNKGIIGWMDFESTPNEIISANLTKKGQISKAIKSNNNYIIFLLNDIKPEEIKPFEQVKEIIKNSLIQDKKNKKFNQLKQKISKAVNSNVSISNIENISGLKSKTTSWFGRNNPPIELNFQKVVNKIFNDRLINKKELKNINSNIFSFDNDKKTFIINIIGRKPEYIQTFYKVKQDILNLVKRQKASLELKKEGDKILSAFKNGNGKRILEELKIKFTGKQYVSRLIPQNAIVNTTMKMVPPVNNNPTYDITRDESENLVIIKLNKIIFGKPNSDELNQLSNEYQNAMYSAVNEMLISSLRQNAKIKIFNLE